MFKIEMKTDNAAFEEDRGEEIARILETVAAAAKAGYTQGVCTDYNGNRVGNWWMTEED